MTTTGMGNPSIVDGDTISEPISGISKKKRKKRKMKSLNEYVNEANETSINENWTLRDMDKVAKSLGDFRKKHPEGSFKSMVGIFLNSVYALVDEKDRNDLQKISKAIEKI